MRMKLGFNYRVHVSRMTLSPISEMDVGSDDAEAASVPDRGAHCRSSSYVTADALVSAPTFVSMTRIHLSRLRAIAVTHY
jgi:hypothetical protein